MSYGQRLTAMQVRFAAEHVKTGLHEQAAITAGYSPASAASQATQLLKNPKVVDEVDRLRAAVMAEANLTPSQIIGGIERIFMDAHESTSNRLKAGELLCKHHGLLTDKLIIESRESRLAASQRGIARANGDQPMAEA